MNPRITFDAEWSLAKVEQAMRKNFDLTQAELEQLKQQKLDNPKTVMPKVLNYFGNPLERRKR